MFLVFREEEQKYLKFISDVTTDILARGIFSNRYVNTDGFLPAVQSCEKVLASFLNFQGLICIVKLRVFILNTKEQQSYSVMII